MLQEGDGVVVPGSVDAINRLAEAGIKVNESQSEGMDVTWLLTGQVCD